MSQIIASLSIFWLFCDLSKDQRQSPMVALPLVSSAWDFIFSQARNCVNALYVHLPWQADGVAGTSAGSYTALKAPQEGIKGFLV